MEIYKDRALMHIEEFLNDTDLSTYPDLYTTTHLDNHLFVIVLNYGLYKEVISFTFGKLNECSVNPIPTDFKQACIKICSKHKICN